MIRRKVTVVTKEVPVPDYLSREYTRVSKAIQTESEEHLPKPEIGWAPGKRVRFFCQTCRSPWPCRFIRWAASLGVHDHWADDERPLEYPPTDRGGRA